MPEIIKDVETKDVVWPAPVASLGGKARARKMSPMARKLNAWYAARVRDYGHEDADLLRPGVRYGMQLGYELALGYQGYSKRPPSLPPILPPPPPVIKTPESE